MAMKFDFGTEMSNGWNLFKENMWPMVITALVASLLSSFSCGIIAGPMTVGLFLIMRRFLNKEEPKPELGDLFKGFQFFLNSFLLILLFILVSVVLSFVPVLGQVASFFLGAFLWWGLMFIAFENLSVGDTITKLVNETKGGDFFLHLLFAVVAGLISSAGILVCCVGVFFTVPIAYCMMVCCYEASYGKAAPAQPLDPNVFLNQ